MIYAIAKKHTRAVINRKSFAKIALKEHIIRPPVAVICMTTSITSMTRFNLNPTTISESIDQIILNFFD
jgi:hypothetical protein